jgi:hypothetical protein
VLSARVMLRFVLLFPLCTCVDDAARQGIAAAAAGLTPMPCRELSLPLVWPRSSCAFLPAPRLIHVNGSMDYDFTRQRFNKPKHHNTTASASVYTFCRLPATMTLHSHVSVPAASFPHARALQKPCLNPTSSHQRVAPLVTG